jgi:iron transport multicopper oxidase
VNRIAVVVGKNAKIYVMNADNLGGYKQGSGGTDNILQTIIATNSVFGGVGSYPLEGGYFYFTPVGDSTYAFKLGFDGSGAPVFAQAGKSTTVAAGRVGVGQPTITTNGGQQGTGIVSLVSIFSALSSMSAEYVISSYGSPIPTMASELITPFQTAAESFNRSLSHQQAVYKSISVLRLETEDSMLPEAIR